MSKFYALGSYTDQALAGFLKNPNSDRSEAIKTLLDSVGAKLVLFDILRGTSDFIMCVDGVDFETFASVRVAVQSTGASNALSSYSKPGE